MMYKIVYLPIALHDLVELSKYIGVELDNPSAADRLAEDISERVSAAAEQPYMYPLYIPIKPLKQEYRKIVVRNYDVFYWVDEPGKTITVARVIYAGRDIRKLLK
ncbi:MAG: type II toxin-antitoxin system RelE/ParE family toxin [Ruminiclostridium sp.]|nr:type II toxin-antitoxin system RelE/ParE family toxin [Ruminiclostridium sp.]